VSAMLSLEGVSFAYAGRTVLDRVSLVLGAGEIVTLLGPSGAGKTSVVRLALGLATPDSGIVRLDGEIASRDGRVLIPPEERNLAVVFQDLALWPHLTVAGNLEFGLAARGVPRDSRAARIAGILSRVGLSGREQSYPGQLSGGERQRVAIARALVPEPRAILLDEPLANLDVGLKRDLLSMFRGLLMERGMTALYVTHELREAAALGDRIVILEEGRVVQDGTLRLLRDNPASEFIRTLVDDLAWTGESRG
jgi:iron(III) transport system ATP-binding protein